MKTKVSTEENSVYSNLHETTAARFFRCLLTRTIQPWSTARPDWETRPLCRLESLDRRVVFSGPAVKLVVDQLITTVVAGVPFTAKFSVRDANDEVVVSATPEVSFSGVDFTRLTAANFAASPVISTAAGIVTISNIVLEASGAYALVVTSPGLQSEPTDTVTVVSGVPFRATLSAPPAGTVRAGVSAGVVTVSVFDVFDNPITNLGQDVKLELAGFGPQFAQATDGVASFALPALERAGSYTLTAVAGDVVAPESRTLTVVPGPASRLRFEREVVEGVQGVTLPTINVRVEDEFTNLVGADSGSVVTLVRSDTRVAVSGALTASTLGGIATFASVNVARAAGFSFTAQLGALRSVTPLGISVVRPAADTVVFTPLSAPAVAGTATMISANVFQFGTPLTARGVSVRFEIRDSNAGNRVVRRVTARVSPSTGVAVFSTRSLTRASNYTVVATQGNGGPALGTTAVTVTPSVARTVSAGVLEAVRNQLPGSMPFTTRVTFFDRFGNVAPPIEGTLTVTVRQRATQLFSSRLVITGGMTEVVIPPLGVRGVITVDYGLQTNATLDPPVRPPKPRRLSLK